MLSYSFGPSLVRHPRRANSSRLSEPQKSNLLVRRLVFNSLTFCEIPQILRALLVRDVIRTLSPVSSSQAIVTSLSDMSALCALTRYHLHKGCTYLTQRHEPKSLGYYITLWSRINSCYSILFSNRKQKKNTSLFVVELLAVTWAPCILRHPILEYCRRAEKDVGPEGDSDTNYSWCSWIGF